MPAENKPDRPPPFKNDRWIDRVLAERRELADGIRYEIAIDL